MKELPHPHWVEWFDVELAPDLLPVRHRVFFGGRGGGKSWAAAAKLIERAWVSPLTILCLREFQNSIDDSAKQLIENLIDRLGIGPSGARFFRFGSDEIVGSNGSRFLFRGLNGKEMAIKSTEGVNIAWVEEAASIPQSAIDALIPTIRGGGSEIWWTYNPRFPTDPVDRLFRGEGAPPPGTVIQQVGWNDNPWFTDVLDRERRFDLSRDPEKHEHIWNGGYLQRSEATVFRKWQVRAFDSPPAAEWLFGADWGFSKDPTVLVRCFVGRWVEAADGSGIAVADPKGPCLFVDHEVYQVGCELDDIPAFFAGSDVRNPPRWSNRFGHAGIPGARESLIRADNARPETVSKMVGHGLRMVAATKGAGSVEDGIEFLRNYDIVVHRRCRHLIQELTLYRYKVDRLTDKVLPDLADKHNHVIDALRYATESARRNIQTDTRHASAGPRVIAASMDGYGFAKPFNDPIAAAEARHRRNSHYSLSSGMHGIMGF